MLDYYHPFRIFTAPEVISNKNINFKSIVYTYSLIIYYIITNKHRFFHLKRKSEVFLFLSNNLRGIIIVIQFSDL